MKTFEKLSVAFRGLKCKEFSDPDKYIFDVLTVAVMNGFDKLEEFKLSLATGQNAVELLQEIADYADKKMPQG